MLMIKGQHNNKNISMPNQPYLPIKQLLFECLVRKAYCNGSGFFGGILIVLEGQIAFTTELKLI